VSAGDAETKIEPENLARSSGREYYGSLGEYYRKAHYMIDWLE